MLRGSDDCLAADLLTVILLKLPVKSIIRFRSVGKEWSHYFQNVNFIFQHLNMSKKNRQTLVYYRIGNLIDHSCLLRLFVDQSFLSYQDMHQNLPNHLPSRSYIRLLVDNGIFCFIDANDQITLCNPTLREFRILSVCHEKIPPNLYLSQRAFGFGLDTLSNDFKVIHIKSLDDGNREHHGYHYAVYNMSTDAWRVLKDEDLQMPKHLLIMNNNNQVCINGVYYWHGDEYILAFHFGTEAFHFIDLPYPYLHGKLIPLQNRLSLWNCDRIPINDRINEIWVLNEDHCWNKVLKIEHILEVNSMLGFWKNSNVLVVSTTGQLLLYNLETKEFMETGIKSRCSWDLLHVYSFEESLVGVRRN